jgi:hypothetical protein
VGRGGRSALSGLVKSRIEVGRDFVVEEDRDSGRGPGQKTLVQSWCRISSIELARLTWFHLLALYPLHVFIISC